MGATPLRNVRASDADWYPALRRAEAEGKSLSEVIREFLREYGSQSKNAHGSGARFSP